MDFNNVVVIIVLLSLVASIFLFRKNTEIVKTIINSLIDVFKDNTKKTKKKGGEDDEQ